jgi:hypothetical protein
VAHQRTFLQRVGSHWICVAPAAILSGTCEPVDSSSPRSLRDEASCDGLCYLQVLRQCKCGDLYQARVAARPEDVEAQTFMVFFTEEQLTCALPWDCRMQNKVPESILAILHAHANEVRPTHKLPAREGAPVHTPAPAVPLQALDEVVTLSTVALQEAVGGMIQRASQDTDSTSKKGSRSFRRQLTFMREAVQAIFTTPADDDMSKRINNFHIQQCLLRVIIDLLMERLYQGQEQAHALLIKAKCALIARLQRWQRYTKQPVVNAIPVFDEERQQVLWHLLVGVPVSTARVAS